MALEGYIAQHLETCKRQKCQLRMYHQLRELQKEETAKVTLGKMLLAIYLRKRYKEALGRFPDSAALRIRYAFFYLEIMQSPAEAMKQFMKAQRCSPALDEDFIIFRYIRLLEDVQTQYKREGEAASMDRVSLLEYDSYYRQCKKKMKEVARLQMEFWAELSMPSPDVVAMIKHGGEIGDVIAEVEEYWGLLQGINANMPKAMRRYAKFLKEVLNDPESASVLLKVIEHENYNLREKELVTQDQASSRRFVEACSRDGTPCMHVSGEIESLGTIKEVNRSFCRIAGYDPAQLIGRSINGLMPPIVARKHDDILREAYNNSQEARMAHKETLQPLQLSNGYMMMIYMAIKFFPALTNDMNYIIVFKTDRTSEFKEQCYLLVDPELNVVGMTGSTFLSLIFPS